MTSISHWITRSWQSINWGDFPTLLGALATIGALIAAVIAYKSLSKQVELLQKQVHDQMEFNKVQKEELTAARDERERQAFERRREQASQVYIEFVAAHPRGLYMGSPIDETKVTLSVTIENKSNRPIYDIELECFLLGLEEIEHGQLDFVRTDLAADQPEDWKRPRLMPGTSCSYVMTFNDDPNPSSYEAVAQFRDAAEVVWLIGDKGYLQEIGQHHKLVKLPPWLD